MARLICLQDGPKKVRTAAQGRQPGGGAKKIGCIEDFVPEDGTPSDHAFQEYTYFLPWSA